MTIQQALDEWQLRKRRMGCVSGADWFCRRVPNFRPLRKRFYYPGGSDINGLFWEHVTVTNGSIELDLTPYANKSSEGYFSIEIN